MASYCEVTVGIDGESLVPSPLVRLVTSPPPEGTEQRSLPAPQLKISRVPSGVQLKGVPNSFETEFTRLPPLLSMTQRTAVFPERHVKEIFVPSGENRG